MGNFIHGNFSWGKYTRNIIILGNNDGNFSLDRHVRGKLGSKMVENYLCPVSFPLLTLTAVTIPKRDQNHWKQGQGPTLIMFSIYFT